MHPAADDDFVICQNAPYGQVLVLPSWRLVHLAADDDFVLYLQWTSILENFCVTTGSFSKTFFFLKNPKTVIFKIWTVISWLMVFHLFHMVNNKYLYFLVSGYYLLPLVRTCACSCGPQFVFPGPTPNPLISITLLPPQIRILSPGP